MLVAVIATVCAALPVLAAAGDPDALRNQIEGAQAKERSLGAQVANLAALESRVQKQLSVLEQRRAEVQADLARDEAQLALVQQELRGERARLARLKGRLEEVRRTLAERLVTRYKASDVDVISVVLNAENFSDLLERADFLRRIQRADQNILITVRNAREDAVAETERLAGAEKRQQEVVTGLRARRNALASMSEAVADRKATLSRVRAARTAALQATRGNRRRLQSRLRSVEAAIAKAASATPSTPASSGGPWAIPWPVVQCESGGQNLPPNSAGASGYYQIIPETWRRSGGSGPAAYLAPKSEQDRVAARIWANDGADSWVCAGLVG